MAIDDALATSLLEVATKIKTFVDEAEARNDRRALGELAVSVSELRAELHALLERLEPYLDGPNNILVRVSSLETAITELKKTKSKKTGAAILASILALLMELLPYLKQLLAKLGTSP